jgi:tetratricopeptide (TPR) repeat protein
MKFIFGILMGVIIVAAAFFLFPHDKPATKQETDPVKQQEEAQPVLKAPLSMEETLDKYIELNPQDSNAYLQKADYLARNGKLEESLPFYDKALYLDGRNVQAYMNRGAVNYMLGNYEAAKRDLSAAINLDASKGENFFNRGLANINLGSYGQAKEDFKQAATLFNKAADKPSFDQANEGYKAASKMLKQSKKAQQVPSGEKVKNIEDKKTSFQTSSNEALNQKYTSQLMTTLSNPDGMLEKFKEAQKKAGNEPGVMPDFESYAASMREQAGKKFKQETAEKTFLDYKDEAYKKQAAGDTKGALEALNKAIELNPKEADLYRQRAQLNMDAKDPKAAIEDYTKALSLNPKDAGSLYNRALAKDILGEKKGAKQDMQQAFDLYKEQGNKEGENQAKEMQNLWSGKKVSSIGKDKDFTEGVNAFRVGDYKSALKSWDNLIKKYPNEASAYYNSAITHLKLNETEKAGERCKQAIERNPNMVEALDVYSNILIGQGKMDEAIQYINKSLAVNPQNASALVNRGYANMQTNSEQAIHDFNEALTYDTENATAYLYRGLLKAEKNQDITGAISDVEKAYQYAQKKGDKNLTEQIQSALTQLKAYQQQQGQ